MKMTFGATLVTLFFVSLPIVPLVVIGDRATQTLTLRPLNAEVVQQHFSDPAFLAGAAYLVAALIFARGGKGSLGSVAVWYLLNGGIIHVMMDGLTGGYHFSPLLDHNYRQLDNRCNEEVPVSAGGPQASAVAVALLVFRLELYVMAPLCFFTFIAIRKNSYFREELEITTSFLQFLGTVFFIGPEFMTQCPNLHPFGKPVCIIDTFSPYDLLYFWFAVGANVVWLYVPIHRMVAAALASRHRKIVASGKNKRN